MHARAEWALKTYFLPVRFDLGSFRCEKYEKKRAAPYPLDHGGPHDAHTDRENAVDFFTLIIMTMQTI